MELSDWSNQFSESEAKFSKIYEQQWRDKMEQTRARMIGADTILVRTQTT
jgi:hypothetical protein